MKNRTLLWRVVSPAYKPFACLLACLSACDRVKDLAGKSYRLLQNNLDKDIVPEESKILIKKDKVIIKLQKVREGDAAPSGGAGELYTGTRARPLR